MRIITTITFIVLLTTSLFGDLLKPVIRYTAEDTPVPVAPNLEKESIPSMENIVNFSKKLME